MCHLLTDKNRCSDCDESLRHRWRRFAESIIELSQRDECCSSRRGLGTTTRQRRLAAPDARIFTVSPAIIAGASGLSHQSDKQITLSCTTRAGEGRSSVDRSESGNRRSAGILHPSALIGGGKRLRLSSSNSRSFRPNADNRFINRRTLKNTFLRHNHNGACMQNRKEQKIGISFASSILFSMCFSIPPSFARLDAGSVSSFILERTRAGALGSESGKKKTRRENCKRKSIVKTLHFHFLPRSFLLPVRPFRIRTSSRLLRAPVGSPLSQRRRSIHYNCYYFLPFRLMFASIFMYIYRFVFDANFHLLSPSERKKIVFHRVIASSFRFTCSHMMPHLSFPILFHSMHGVCVCVALARYCRCHRAARLHLLFNINFYLLSKFNKFIIIICLELLSRQRKRE